MLPQPSKLDLNGSTLRVKLIRPHGKYTQQAGRVYLGLKLKMHSPLPPPGCSPHSPSPSSVWTTSLPRDNHAVPSSLRWGQHSTAAQQEQLQRQLLQHQQRQEAAPAAGPVGVTAISSPYASSSEASETNRCLPGTKLPARQSQASVRMPASYRHTLPTLVSESMHTHGESSVLEPGTSLDLATGQCYEPSTGAQMGSQYCAGSDYYGSASASVSTSTSTSTSAPYTPPTTLFAPSSMYNSRWQQAEQQQRVLQQQVALGQLQLNDDHHHHHQQQQHQQQHHHQHQQHQEEEEDESPAASPRWPSQPVSPQELARLHSQLWGLDMDGDGRISMLQLHTAANAKGACPHMQVGSRSC